MTTNKLNARIYEYIKNAQEHKKYNAQTIEVDIITVIELINLVYQTIKPDPDTSRFIPANELIVSMQYGLSEKQGDKMFVVIKEDKNNRKIRTSGRLEDSPAQGENELALAYELAQDSPVLILLHETGNDETWNYRPFWWPVLVMPQNTKKAIFASKVPDERLSKTAK